MTQSPQYTVALASSADREAIYQFRHAVYAEELGQHPTNATGRLDDALDAVNTYIVLRKDDRVVGFISITPPSAAGYSVEKYVDRESLPVPFDSGLYELRLLTVLPEERGTLQATLLMYAGFRWISSQGATHVVALGRTGAPVRLYEKVGLRHLGQTVSSGAVCFEVMAAAHTAIQSRIEAMAPIVARLRTYATWDLSIPFDGPTACYHGGASIRAAGDAFDDLSRVDDLISADVLDAWFPPAPSVIEGLRAHTAYLLRTSPPTDAGGLQRAIAKARDVPYRTIVLGAGSSDLIFRAFQAWLTPTSRVLLLDPTYGEYAHVTEHVVGCRVDRLPLRRTDDYRIDLDALIRRSRAGGPGRYDMVVLVNPNSPTGQVLPREAVLTLRRTLPATTRLWVDEAYVDYVGSDASVEPFVADVPNLVVCKSMSKVYALSGARVGYLCAAPPDARALDAITPPWIVSGPAQLAAIRALEEPDYYADRYRETHALRADLATGLRALPVFTDVVESSANFVLAHVSPAVAVEALCAACRRRGLYLRDLRGMTAREGPDSVRIAVKDAATNARMLAILHEVERELGSARSEQNAKEDLNKHSMAVG